jgi:inositol phosphorylceramide synthase catalytic subunit
MPAIASGQRHDANHRMPADVLSAAGTTRPSTRHIDERRCINISAGDAEAFRMTDSIEPEAKPTVVEAASDAEKKRIRRLQIIALTGMAFYLWSVQAMMGIRGEHITLCTVYVILVAVGGRGFRFLGLFLPVMLTGISYEYFRLLKGVRLEVHVADLYHAELNWFGVGQGADRKVLADWFLAHTHPVVDLICGLAYIFYIIIPIGLAVGLYFFDHKRMLHVGLAFLLTNLLGLAVYTLYPAAPPWYVAEYGLGPARMDVLPSAAGTVRFDQLLGIDYFTTFYSRSANVFGAMPSLHVGFPMSSVIAVAVLGKKWWVPIVLFVALVGFSAVYLQHHYVWDVVAGLVVGTLGGLAAAPVARRLAPDADSATEPKPSPPTEAALA